MQALIDELSKGWRAERSLSQMTLGKLLSKLKRFPSDKKITTIQTPHSYRGYYSDLAFQFGNGEKTIKETVNMLKNECLGKTFTGYKGGEFLMDEHTPLWIANYGCCGDKIVDITDGDSISFVTEEEK